MELFAGISIVNLILWLITWCIIAEQQEIQDEYNKLLINEIYELKKEEGIKKLKQQIAKISRED